MSAYVLLNLSNELGQSDKMRGFFATSLLIVTVNVLRLFLAVPWVGLCVILVFPDHTYLLFNNSIIQEHEC